MQRLWLLIALLSLGFAPAPLPKPPKPTRASADLQAMQGRWVNVCNRFGEVVIPGRNGNLRVVGPKFGFFLGDNFRKRWSISLHPEKNRTRFVAKAIAGDRKGRTIRGTYHLEGNRLILSYFELVGPGGFGIGPAVNTEIVLTYRRSKP